MTTPTTRPCPQCKAPVAAAESRCPRCGATLSIVTMPIEALPRDTGAADEGAIEPAAGELLPPEDGAEGLLGATARSYSMRTSFSTRVVGGAPGRVDADVKIDLPQALIDPENRLSAAAYWKLMHRWSEAIEQEIEAASQSGQTLDPAAMPARVPLPFGSDCGADLPLAIRDAMNQRAQHHAAQLLRLPRPADVFGPHAGPGLDPDAILRELGPGARSPSRPRRGFTITCGSLLGAALLIAAGGLYVAWWGLPF